MGSCPTLPPCRSTPGTAGMLSPEFLIFAQYNSQTLVIQTPTPKLQFVLLQFIKHYCKIVLQCVDDFCRLMKLSSFTSEKLCLSNCTLTQFKHLICTIVNKMFFFYFFCTTPQLFGKLVLCRKQWQWLRDFSWSWQKSQEWHLHCWCNNNNKKKNETNPNLKYLLYKLKLKNLFFKSSFI